MFILILNDMRSSNIEIVRPVLRAETREQLEKVLASEAVDYYNEGGWGKKYRKDGPLEWYNPPFEDNYIRDMGTSDDWARDAECDYNTTVMSLPEATI